MADPRRVFRILAAATLAFTLAVIAWGAFVRATGSGAGCGAHWPVCNGVVIPRAPSVATTIEYVHRLTSAVALLLTLALFVSGFSAYPRGHRVRRAVTWVLVFMLTEAAVGAMLVLQQWVAQDVSTARSVAVSVHLFNTFLLLGAQALAWSWAAPPREISALARPRDALFWAVTVGWLGVGVTGAIAALGDTLFPAQTLRAGLLADAAPAAHFLVRLRVVHPVLAATVALAAVGASLRLAARVPPSGVRRSAVAVSVLVGVQCAVGVVNLLLLAPVPLQLAHLIVGDILWIAWVRLGGSL